ncbi:MAG: fatty acid desaturase [Bordetella sp.]|nr:MAG: fatty acid desaturase [Bordetella sp.]
MDFDVLSFLFGGYTQASWKGIVIFTLIMTHITIVSVTIFLHRSQAHRGLNLHKIPMHFFRFWLWLTTGMITKEWVAIHRKHHAKCEKKDDPHSPIIFGIWKVLFRGAELYRRESFNKETLDRFGYGTPQDWIENNLYSKHSLLGVLIMLGINILLFGILGITVWAIQMSWIPFWAAGVVNGVGHYWGYRNYSSPDTSTNLIPWGIIIGGEELHNNHHAYGTSAKFSNKWYEIDLGWFYICILKFLGLAKVKKVAPKLKLISKDTNGIDLLTLQGVITHRYEVMANYTNLIKSAAKEELKKLKIFRKKHNIDCNWTFINRAFKDLHQNEEIMKPERREAVNKIISGNKPLKILIEMRNELGLIWESSGATSDQLLQDLQQWCQRAQKSGIDRLEKFATNLCRYAA